MTDGNEIAGFAPTFAAEEGNFGVQATTTRETEVFGQYDWCKIMPVAFGGHCYLVRQNITGEQEEGGSMWDRTLDGIYIPEEAADRSLIVTVLGIGPNVGKRPTRAHRKRYNWGGGMPYVAAVKVGDELLLAFEKGEHGTLTNKIRRNPLNWDEELFIEQSLPDAILYREAGDTAEITARGHMRGHG